MVHQANRLFGSTQADSSRRTDTLSLARKRANDYLKLHHLPEAERERLLECVAQKLVRVNVHTEQEMIQKFITTLQEELAFEHTIAQTQKPTAKATASIETETDISKPESRNKTGPRFERSSISVAPLQAISLRLLRQRQFHIQH